MHDYPSVTASLAQLAFLIALFPCEIQHELVNLLDGRSTPARSSHVVCQLYNIFHFLITWAVIVESLGDAAEGLAQHPHVDDSEGCLVVPVSQDLLHRIVLPHPVSLLSTHRLYLVHQRPPMPEEEQTALLCLFEGAELDGDAQLELLFMQHMHKVNSAEQETNPVAC